MPRTRSKDPVDYSFQFINADGDIYYEGGQRFFTDTLVDEKQKPCRMTRDLYYPFNGIQQRVDSPDSHTRYYNQIGQLLDPNVYSAHLVIPYMSRFKWKKLPTSNQADLLTALAEADDTIAMFGKNLASSASYGGYKWGWTPLVSDIMAVNDSVNSVKNSLLDGSKRSVPYNTTDKFTIVSPKLVGPRGTVKHTWDVNVKYRGTITYENDILSFYDYMGFHPSPKLFWDLIPLSFALDYVLPIGDMLKSITPVKGWVKSANFTGWRVISYTISESLIAPPPELSVQVPGGKSYHVRRDLLRGVALEQKEIKKPIELVKLPTIEQAFDLSYLSETFYNRAKGLVSPHVYKKRRK